MTKPRVAFGGRHVPLPRSKALRVSFGILLILGGVVGFLPVLGFWMVPLGILILSFDLHIARRLRRRTIVWWERRKRIRRESL
ncbi:PGPGW domain-containing protein [Microvirga guangxiensis]|uniref:Putative transmembrane protein (PGPGW) n=1 Tax=Microvirga guangxiensis TaxID=549386 RepID=A0A1G5L569_9HYPH|nr:PGPGW domain-containing protein [Microvirga guangxiensis]SCZ07410.1 Putative transmembrane protein (PGPGW) [Microvirga guangxiensis]